LTFEHFFSSVYVNKPGVRDNPSSWRSSFFYNRKTKHSEKSMKTMNNLFFAIRTVAGSVLWFLFNILSYVLVCMYAIVDSLFRLSRWENKFGGKSSKWPECLKIGTHNWILPYHFVLAGIWIAYILNPKLGLWMILLIFLSFSFLEFLGIIISYLHKWTEEAGKPLWSSVDYEDLRDSDWSFR